MSFDPIRFKFTPPPTVSLPVLPVQAALSSLPAATGTGAGGLITQLNNLSATSDYLQKAIVDRFSSTGVEIDLSARPEAAAALSRIYGTDSPPSIITIPMLANMLDAEASIIQMELGLGLDSQFQPNPVQAADLSLVTGTVETMLAENGAFANQLPNLLRPLKADAIVFQNWSAALSQYPVLRSSGSVPLLDPSLIAGNLLSGRTIDTSTPVAQIFSQFISKYSINYSSIYGFMSGVSSIDRTITSVVQTYVTTPAQDVVRIISLLEGLKGIFHKNFLKNTTDILATFVFARLASEIGGMVFSLDRYIQMAVSPIRNSVSQVSQLLNLVNNQAKLVEQSINQVASAVETLTGHGGVPGLPQSNACGSRPHASNASSKSKPLIDPKGIPGLGPKDVVPQSLVVLGQHLNWAMTAADREANKIQTSLRKLVERKLQMTADKLDTLCSLQSIDSLVSLARGVVNATQKGGVVGNGSVKQNIEAFNLIVSQATSGSGTPYVIQDGEVVAVPANLPTPPPSVEGVLRAGLERTTAADFISRNRGVNAV